jgi:hypothetical protein
MVRMILSARPSLGVLQDVHRIALEKVHRLDLAMRENSANTGITDLIKNAISLRLLARELSVADRDGSPSVLQRFVRNRLYEPRVMKIVKQFL